MLNPRYSELEAKGEPTEQWGYDNPMVALQKSIYSEIVCRAYSCSASVQVSAGRMSSMAVAPRTQR